MYEDLETIATLKFGKVMETISERTRANVREVQCQYAALTGASGARSGQHEASIARIWIEGAEQLAHSLFNIWVDLIKQRKGHIERGDIGFVAGKIEGFTRSQTGHLRKVFTQRPSAIIPMLSEEAERRMYAVSAAARRDLEIMAREHEAFPKIAAPVNSTPKPPATESASSNSAETPTPPREIPNKGLFAGIIGIALTLFVAILQANGAEVKWQASIVIYIVLACVCAWSFWKHAVPHKGRLIRYGGALLLLSIIMSIGIYGTVKQYHREHSIIDAQSTPPTLAGQNGAPATAGNPPSNSVPGRPAQGPTGKGTATKDTTLPSRAVAQHSIAPGASIQQNSTGDCSPNNIGSGNTFNVNCAPQPKVIATPQVQRQTGNPDMPWEVGFTISSTALVQTGDLRLTCNGPTIRAGISRINPAFFASGNNGPSKGDPNTVVYEIEPEMLSPGKIVTIVVYSKAPIMVISGSIGSQKIVFPK